MAKGIDAKAMAAAQTAAADVVKSWTDAQLEQLDAPGRLATSWGLALSTTRGIVNAEHARRRIAKAAA